MDKSKINGISAFYLHDNITDKKNEFVINDDEVVGANFNVFEMYDELTDDNLDNLL